MSVHPDRPTHGQDAGRAVAFYDVDGTLVDCNIVQAYLYYALRSARVGERLTRLLDLAARAPRLLATELLDRRALNENLFAAYAGLSQDRLETLAEGLYTEVIRPRIYPGARDLLERNREAGLEPVLVTGSPDFVIRPLARDWRIEHVAANRLVFHQGVATGRLRPPVLAGPEKAAWMRQFAARHGISLGASSAYADSFADLPMLCEVGRPFIVNPDLRLRSAARSRRWPALRFR